MSRLSILEIVVFAFTLSLQCLEKNQRTYMSGTSVFLEKLLLFGINLRITFQTKLFKF